MQQVELAYRYKNGGDRLRDSYLPLALVSPVCHQPHLCSSLPHAPGAFLARETGKAVVLLVTAVDRRQVGDSGQVTKPGQAQEPVPSV